MTATRYSVPFTPLTERIAHEAPQLSAGLAALQIAIGTDHFEKYINSLLALRRIDDQLLMITRKEMYRSIIMSKFLPEIRESFAVNFIRIVNQ